VIRKQPKGKAKARPGRAKKKERESSEEEKGVKKRRKGRGRKIQDFVVGLALRNDEEKQMCARYLKIVFEAIGMDNPRRYTIKWNEEKNSYVLQIKGNTYNEFKDSLDELK